MYPHAGLPISAIFQSTPPVKAATPPVPDFGGFPDISIHAAREGGDFRCHAGDAGSSISIHAAREGGDLVLLLIIIMLRHFNPRRP